MRRLVWYWGASAARLLTAAAEETIGKALCTRANRKKSKRNRRAQLVREQTAGFPYGLHRGTRSGHIRLTDRLSRDRHERHWASQKPLHPEGANYTLCSSAIGPSGTRT